MVKEMHNLKVINCIVIVTLVLSLCGCNAFSEKDVMAGTVSEYQETAKPEYYETPEEGLPESHSEGSSGEKEELVYVSLFSDGSIEKVNVINTVYPQNGTFSDYGEYADVKDLSGTDKFTYSDGKICGESKENTVVYMGSMPDPVLPWTVSIDYFLNGQKVTSSELARKTGELRIEVAVDKNIKYSEEEYDDYIISLVALLDNRVFSRVSAENAQVSGISDKQIITAYSVPGEALKMKLTADVQNFHMPRIEINVMKPDGYNAQIDDSNIREEIDRILDLKADISEEKDDSIADLNLDDISSKINEFSNNTDELCAKADEFSDEFAKIKDNTGKVVDGTQEIENNAALLYNASIRFEDSAAEIANSIIRFEETYRTELPPDIIAQLETISEGSKKLLDSASELTDSSMQLLDGGIELHEGTAELNDSVAEVDVKDFSDKVHDAKDKILEIKEQTDRITQDVDDMKARVNEKMDQYDEKISDAKAKIDDISDSIDREIDEIKKSDTQDGVISFASAKNGKVGSVVFIMKTHAIGE